MFVKHFVQTSEKQYYHFNMVTGKNFKKTMELIDNGCTPNLW